MRAAAREGRDQGRRTRSGGSRAEQDCGAGRDLLLYAIVGAGGGSDGAGLAQELEGAGPGVRLVDCGSFAALVGPAQRADYAGPHADERARDIDWLLARAREFERALGAAMAAGCTVLPVRLGTLFRSERSLHEALGARSLDFVRELAVVAEWLEWAVKAYAVAVAAGQPRRDGGCARPQVSRRAGGERAGGTTAAPGTGAAYLLARRRADEAEQRTREARVRALASAREQLLASALDSRRLSLLPSALTGRLEAQVWNEAFLVRRGEEGAFAAALERVAPILRRAGVALDATGPWPPYSFVGDVLAPPEGGA